MTLETLGNELAKRLADIFHSLVSSKLEKMANETVLRAGPLEPDLINRVAKRGRPSHRFAASPNNQIQLYVKENFHG
jgi:hypothetical protein